MRCLLDLDGVCCDLLPTWLDMYSMLGGETIAPDSVTTYDIGIAKDREKLFRALAHVQYSDVAPFDGVAEAINMLRSTVHSVRFVSYVPECAPAHFAGKAAWCARFIPGFEASELIFCASEEKAYVTGEWLVEDRPLALKQWGYRNFARKDQLFLINQPYNQESVTGVTRVNSLLDAAKEICK